MLPHTELTISAQLEAILALWLRGGGGRGGGVGGVWMTMLQLDAPCPSRSLQQMSTCHFYHRVPWG
jgi:hypothetical protein